MAHVRPAAAGTSRAATRRRRPDILDSSWGDAANTFEVPSVTLFDAAVHYDLGKRWPSLKGVSLSVTASNIFDKTYITSCLNRTLLHIWRGTAGARQREISLVMKSDSDERPGLAPWRGLTRRATICGLSAFSFTSCLRAATPTPRIASLNWALSETLYAMKIRPVCAVEIPGYNRMVGYPTTPPGPDGCGVTEAIQIWNCLPAFRQISFSYSNGKTRCVRRCRASGASRPFTLYTRGGDPFARAEETLERIGKLADAPDARDRCPCGKRTPRFPTAALGSRPMTGRPIYLVQALEIRPISLSSQRGVFLTA